MPLCDCRYAQIREHEPHQALFCAAPIELTPEMAEIFRRPPKPLKIPIDVKVDRE